MSEVDVAVVGAGAAGLAAGKALRDRGASTVVLEARSRTGGRAWTDAETFPGLSFDRGCHWLHSASINPFREIADRLGFAYNRRNTWTERAVYQGARSLGREAVEAFGAEMMATFEAIHRPGQAGRDISALEAAGPGGPWRPVVAHIFSLVTSGELDEVSVLDSSRYRDTEEDYPVEAGYGALIAAYAKDVKVETDSPVTAIEVSATGVRIETTRGTIRAKAVIVTVSTSVLAGGAIRFTPALPVTLLEAIDACRLGCAEKIAFRLDRPLEDAEPGSFLSFQDDREGADALHPVNCYVTPFGRPMILCHTGGRFGRELHMAGEAAAIDYGRSVLARCFGSQFRKRIVGATATGWVRDPYIRGGYSFARPGKAELRRRLAEPFSDRIFLAGEATSLEFYSTAHGAHLTGVAAVERAIAAAKK